MPRSDQPAQDSGFSLTGTTWLGYRRRTKNFSRVMLVMFLAGVATFAQLYSPQAILPELGSAFNVQLSTAALTISMSTAGLALTVLPWTVVADRIGRRKTIAWSVFLATTLALLLGLAPNFATVLVLRFFEGAALGGVPAAAMAYINEEVHRLDAAFAAGMFIAGNALGGVGGRLLAGPITEFTGMWRLGVLVVALLSVVCAVLFILLAPRAKGYIPLRQRRPLRQDIAHAWAHVKIHARTPKLVILYAQAFVTMGAFVAVYNYLGAYLTAPPYLLPLWLVSFAFLAYLAGMVASPVAGRLAARFGRKRVMLFGFGLALVSLVMMAVPNLSVILAGLAIYTAAFFASHSVASGWAGAAPDFGRAQSTGLYNFCYYIGSSVIGYLGGILFERWGWIPLLVTLGALLAAVSLMLLVFARNDT